MGALSRTRYMSPSSFTHTLACQSFMAVGPKRIRADLFPVEWLSQSPRKEVLLEAVDLAQPGGAHQWSSYIWHVLSQPFPGLRQSQRNTLKSEHAHCSREKHSLGGPDSPVAHPVSGRIRCVHSSPWIQSPCFVAPLFSCSLIPGMEWDESHCLLTGLHSSHFPTPRKWDWGSLEFIFSNLYPITHILCPLIPSVQVLGSPWC